VFDSLRSNHDRGQVTVNPDDLARLSRLGIQSATSFLDLAGEVISGHPDRHVLRLELSGYSEALYLKRQHRNSFRERLQNWLAGYGWVSRCEREGIILQQLASCGLPGPRFIASGSDRNRAFLLVEGIPDAVDLRQVLSDTTIPTKQRRCLAMAIGELIAALHASGFTTPDLTAKHVMVSARGITFIDWQSSRWTKQIRLKDRIEWLAKLHASLSDWQATERERCRVLWAALRSARRAGVLPERFSTIARKIDASSRSKRSRRSIQDQRHSVIHPTGQRLVWVADEAVCAIPSIAKNWPEPAVGYPYYFADPGTCEIKLPNGQWAYLIRGQAVAPFGRLGARLRGRPWRSRGVTLGRLLFHLERYGIAAPKLLAFGQRLTGICSAEWFVLHSLPAKACTHPDPYLAEQLGKCLRQIHDAGCRLVSYPLTVFGVHQQTVCVRDVTGVQLASSITDSLRERDLDRLLNVIPPASRIAAELGYRRNHHFPSSLDAGATTIQTRSSMVCNE
jgi:tRNA A-37 threonylcarbamoyl transferase component Bud32